VTITLRVALALLGYCLIALASTGSEVYSRLSYLWGFLILGNWLWSYLSMRGVALTRIPRIRRAEMGQVFEERYDIYNSGTIPRLWLEVRDESALPGSRGSHVVTLVGRRQRRSYLARSRLMQRGIFPLGPTVLASGDPFGMFPRSTVIEGDDRLMVYPLILDIQSFPNPPGLLTGGESIRRRTHHVTPNAAGVREYAPGDGLNRIHWPTTVRRDKLMVKEFELDPLADIWLFLDGERAVQHARSFSTEAMTKNIFLHERLDDVELPPDTEEYATSIAASLARFYLRGRRAVGMIASGRHSSVLPPDRGGRQLGKLLESLALFKADGGLPMSGLIDAQAQHIARGSTVVIITPDVREELALALDFLARRGLRPIVVLIDAESFGGAPGTMLLGKTIQSFGIPVRRVVNGDDIREALITSI
jgi:uncharacterized protein (DUF58 family)